jgi:DNA-binding GntR family transcriptional regulator
MKKVKSKAEPIRQRAKPKLERVAHGHKGAVQKRAGRMSVLDAHAGTPSMADRAYDYLTDRLSNGSLRGGDVIQESRLAEKLNLSRTPVRDALGRLESEGLLERSGRALVVRRVSIKEFLDMLHVRRLIEPEAAFLAAGKMDASLLADLKQKLLAAPGNQTSADLFALDESIHLTIANSLRNDCLADLVRNLRRRTRLFELTEFPGKRSDRMEHLKLIDALIASNAQEAKDAMLEHLDILREEVVGQIRNL